jgi:hypothetical protein
VNPRFVKPVRKGDKDASKSFLIILCGKDLMDVLVHYNMGVSLDTEQIIGLNVIFRYKCIDH